MTDQEEVAKLLKFIDESTKEFPLEHTCSALLNLLVWKVLTNGIAKEVLFQQMVNAWDHNVNNLLDTFSEEIKKEIQSETLKE
jgi:hypothetical protein